MKINTIKSQLVYCKEFETSLKEIGQYVGETPAQMMQEVAAAGGKMAGPQVWQYEGADGRPDTRFKLTIAVPIEEKIDSLAPNIQTLPDFECATTIHNGAWNELGQTYMSIADEILKAGKQLGQVCREVYHTVDFENPANNVTEIQMQFQ